MIIKNKYTTYISIINNDEQAFINLKLVIATQNDMNLLKLAYLVLLYGKPLSIIVKLNL